ncbi:MAG: GTPase Era [Myxococcales bacterium]|nr:GTPase Era [Myxococcales bacterium]
MTTLPPSPTPTPAGFRAGFCAIVGRPNVGKSTYLNRVLGEKLAAVTPKPQTTRNRILGVRNLPLAQIVYVDTPGIHRGRSSLNRYMVDQALRAAAECDVVLLLVEAPRGAPRAFEIGPGQQLVLDAVCALAKPRILGVNKVDLLLRKDALLPLLDGYSKIASFDEVVPMSAATGLGVDALEAAITSRLPESERLFPEDMLTDRAERFLAAELVREQIFLQLGDELPYSIAIDVQSFRERSEPREVTIEANVVVERDSQKRIVVGNGGRMLKEIGMKARAEIGRLLGCPVHLKLFVKIDPDWTTRNEALKRLGYV